jgi:hypothetical protein
VVLLEGDGLALVSWNHRPTLVRAALRRSGGFAQWKPRWHLLVVPTGHLVDGVSNVFSEAAAKSQPAQLTSPFDGGQAKCHGPVTSPPDSADSGELKRTGECRSAHGLAIGGLTWTSRIDFPS